MKLSFFIFLGMLMSTILSGCMASTASTVGVSCNYSQGKLLWELPLTCQGGH